MWTTKLSHAIQFTSMLRNKSRVFEFVQSIFFPAYQRVLSRSSVFENRNMVRWLSSLESCPSRPAGCCRNLLFLTWLSLFALWHDDVQLTVVRLLRHSDSWLRGYRLLSSRSHRSLCSNLIIPTGSQPMPRVGTKTDTYRGEIENFRGFRGA